MSDSIFKFDLGELTELLVQLEQPKLAEENRIVAEAVTQIEAEKLNLIRCSITGAPVATAHTSEVNAFIRSHVKTGVTNVESLVDHWLLARMVNAKYASVVFNNSTKQTLRSMMDSCDDWAARFVAYSLGRFVFATRAGSKDSTYMLNKHDFVVAWYDLIASVDSKVAQHMAHRLFSLDFWRDLATWHDMDLMKPKLANKSGISGQQNKVLLDLVSEPMEFKPTIEGLIKVTNCMLSITRSKGATPDSARERNDKVTVASEITRRVNASIVEEDFGVVPESKAVRAAKSTETLDFMLAKLQEQMMGIENLRKPTMAWSVTHGRGHTMNAPYTNPRAKKADVAAKAATPTVIKEKKPAGRPAKQTSKQAEIAALVSKLGFKVSI